MYKQVTYQDFFNGYSPSLRLSMKLHKITCNFCYKDLFLPTAYFIDFEVNHHIGSYCNETCFNVAVLQLMSNK